MELRSCVNTHFIHAIRAGEVIRVRNIDSHGKPALVFKTLMNVYASEDAKRVGRPPILDSHNGHAGLTYEHEQVKCEIPFPPVSCRAKRETVEFFPLADDGSDSDLDDSTTLKQLKERSLRKKRKFDNGGGNSNQAYVDKKPVKDEPDLDEPLINWKSKKSKKTKVKRKHMNGCVVSSSYNASAIKSEHDIVSGNSLQAAGEVAQIVSVKVEVQEAEELGCQSQTSFTDDSFLDHDEGPILGDVASNNFQKTAQSEYREPLSSAEENQICVTNEIYYDHLDDVLSMSTLLPGDGMSDKLESLELDSHEFLDLPTLATEMGEESMEAHSCHFSASDEQNPDVFLHPGNSSSMEEISERSNNSGRQGPDASLDGSLGCMGPFDKSESDLLHEQDDCLNSHDKNSDTSRDSCILLKTDDNLDELQTLSCNRDDIRKICLNHGGHVEDDLLMFEEKRSSASMITNIAAQSYLTNQTSDSTETLLSPEPCQSPERPLHPKRKAISPSSQERLCLAMNSVELSDDFDQYKCTEKLFGNQTCKKVSPVKLTNQHAKVTVDDGVPRQIRHRKVISSPRHTMKKSQNAQGNLEGPSFSSTPTKLSTGSSSIQGCSESAIAFSQRQMHDMETLAGKLMNELNSMKDIVEQKLLFEAYRSISLKHDADEIKSAINNATKVEEAAQKWLTMMSRDCNRFCKIMKLTGQSIPGSKDAVTRDRKKIIFADEAGGKLCHVKFFEADTTSEVSDAENRRIN